MRLEHGDLFNVLQAEKMRLFVPFTSYFNRLISHVNFQINTILSVVGFHDVVMLIMMMLLMLIMVKNSAPKLLLLASVCSIL